MNPLPPTREWIARYTGTSGVPVANGLTVQQFRIPVGDYIFPENTTFGDPILVQLPFGFHTFPFLTQGSGPLRGTGPIVGPLDPFPLVIIPGMNPPTIPAPPVC